MKAICLIFILAALSLKAQLPIISGSVDIQNPGSSFNPNSFNPVLWVDIDSNILNQAGSAPVNNDTIKQWTDCSGNGKNLTQTGGATVSPTYKTSTGPPSGSPIVHFPGGTANMNLTNRNVTVFSQPNTFFFVINMAGGDQAYMNCADSQNEQISSAAATGAHFFAGTDVNLSTRLNQAGVGGWGLVTYEFNGASSAVYTSHLAVVTAVNPGAGAMKGMTFGSFFNGTGPGNVDVTDIIWYNQVFSTSDRRKIEQWLGTKRNLYVAP